MWSEYPGAQCCITGWDCWVLQCDFFMGDEMTTHHDLLFLFCIVLFALF